MKYAENTLERIAKEKKLLEEEKFQTEALFQKCDTWISICMECLNCLDKKLENELTRNDNGIIESKKVRIWKKKKKVRPTVNFWRELISKILLIPARK